VLKTWLTDRFDLQVPVVSAPMAGVSGGALAGAVSAAGGLGLIGFAAGPPEALRAECEIAAHGGRPFGVGLLAWLLPRDESLLDLALDSGAALVSVSFGDYAPYVDRIKSAGAVAATQVGTLDDLRAAEAAGVDVVVVRGGEGGGHGRDVVATLPLLQAALETTDLPVLAAGGIATARGLAAVLAAGAAGAWVGTAFLACDESAYDDTSRQAVIDAALTDTVYTTVLDIGRGSPWPSEFGGRAITSAYAQTWHGREDELRADPVRNPDAPVWAGQAVGLVTAQRAAAAVVAELAGAEALLADVCRRATGG
jgi:nitronate monooxygenase